MPWLRIDRDMRVVEASAAALAQFGNPGLPTSLISFGRSTDIESRAREILDGGTGPWEVDAANFRLVFRMRGIDLGDEGALVYLENITDVRKAFDEAGIADRLVANDAGFWAPLDHGNV